MIFLKKYKKEDMTHINKIGIIMFGLLGDVLLRTPVIRALKDIYPEAKLIAIVDPIGKAVLLNNHYVDDTIIIMKDKNKLKQNIDKLAGILSIRDEKFDLLVNLYNGGSSPLMVLLSGARYKLGFCKQKKKYIYNVENQCEDDRLKEEQRVSSHMMSIIEPLSDKKYSLTPVFDVDNLQLDIMYKYISSFNVDIHKVYVLNLGSSKEDKILQNNKYLHLVQYIYNEYGFIPAIVLNPGQEYLQEDLINNFLVPNNLKFIKLKKMSLAELASLINLTSFIITPDTGLMHLATAFDNFIFTIFTYTHPIFVDPKNDKFIAVYESFDDGKLYQSQDISTTTFNKNINLLFSKIDAKQGVIK